MIVCTPVAITLDAGAAELESDPTPTEVPGGQLLLPIPQPRRATENPDQNHPVNVNDFWSGLTCPAVGSTDDIAGARDRVAAVWFTGAGASGARSRFGSS